MAWRSQRAATWQAGVWDRIGLGLSGLCALHCLMMPFVLATLPFWTLAFDLHAWLHAVFAVLLVPVTVLAVRSGSREGGRAVGVLLGAGLVIVVGAVLAHEPLGPMGEALVTLLGSVLLVTGHWRNGRARGHGDGHSVRHQHAA